MKIFLLIILLSFVNGCGAFHEKEIGRLSLTQTSSNELHMKQINLNLKKGDEISFWTKIDIEFEENIRLIYSIEVWKDDKKLGGLELDALKTNPTMMEVRTNFGNKTSWSFTGKMNFISIYEDGDYIFKVALYQSDNSTLKINKANIIFKKQ